MKIAIVVPYFSGFGSNESEMAEEFTRQGHQVTVFTTKVTKGSRFQFITHRKFVGYTVKYVPVIFNFIGWPLTIDFTKDLFGFDLIMVQEDYQYMSYIGYLAAKKYNIRMIVSNERYYLPSFPKSLFLKIIEFFLTNRIRKFAKHITVHEDVAVNYLKSRGVNKKISVIPTAINTAKFYPYKSDRLRKMFSISKTSKIILSIGRLVSFKNYDKLIKQFGGLSEDYVLVIIGRGPERNKLFSTIKKNNLNNVIICDEFIPHKNMPSIINSCDIYIQPSLVEPFGIAVREAMACGKPIIVTNIGGLKGLIEKNGAYINVSVINLKMAIDIVFKNYNPFSKNSLSLAKSYDVRKICEDYLKLK